MSSELVVVFSKSADPGSVKTRMTPILSPENCLSLHLALLKDTLEKIRKFSALLYLAGSGYLPFEPGVPIRFQTGEDLGARLHNAFQTEFERHSKIVIIGTDSPTFPAEQISNAFLALNRVDIVLGPSEDGGYYLIGLRKLIPELFSQIPWGTEEVLAKTLDKIFPHSYMLLQKYFDVDWPEDLKRLKQELTVESGLKNIRDWIRDYWTESAR